MALTRSEIELIIKARNQAQQAFDQLGGQITKITGEAGKASVQMDTLGTKTKTAGTGATAAGVAFGLLAERVARGLVGAFNDTIQAANRLDAGLIGLSSVATAFGQDAGRAQDAAKKLAADGLMSVGEAATGLKNLLAAGFGLDQATTLMLRFKDSAAFGKQGALEFGQAIVGATEGIKNGNSILVDNAGVTKNLSQMLVEAGFSAQDLSKASSDVNVRMAIFNGILKETKPQLGDTEKFLGTAAGKQAQFNSQVEIAQQKIGKALQPALAGLLNALTPLVKVIGDNADVLVPLGMAAAAVVAPLAAMRAAAALGIPSITGLGSSMASTLSIFKGVRSFADARAGIQLVGESAGLTTANLGKLGTAAAIAGAAFVGWQIGKVIDQLTGASGAVENLTNKIMGYKAALDEQVAGAKQDTVNQAIRNGAAATITYTQAIEYNGRVQDIRAAQWDKSVAAQQRAIDAELALGRITTEQANARREQLAGEQAAQDVAARRVKMTDALAAAEQKYQAEIKATGYTQAELVKLVKDNEQGFDAYAKSVNLSDTTIKRLKDTLKGKEEQLKKNKKAADDLREAQEKLRGELEQMAGIIDQATLQARLKRISELLAEAGKVSAPALTQATIAAIPVLEELMVTGQRAGLGIDAVRTALDKARAVQTQWVAETVPQLQLVSGLVGNEFPGSVMKLQTAEELLAEFTQKNLTDSYHHFGLKTRDELQRTAQDAELHYRTIAAAVGKNAPEAQAAYKKMIDAQRAVTGELPSYWETNVFPGIKRVVENIQTAVQGSFAQMLLGAKGFSEGFQDIWKSLKSGVLNILNEILSSFINSFLKGLLGAMSGQRGAFQSAFGSLFGGGGGGGIPGMGGGGIPGMGGILGKIPGLGGLFGGGGAAATIGANGIPVLNVAGGLPAGFGGAGAGGAAGGGGLFGLSSAGLFGGLGAAGGGFGLGMLGGKLFGGGTVKSGAFGAGTGFAQGALLGSIVPGLGTLVGGGIGALSGLIGGLLGGGNDTRKSRDKFSTDVLGADYKSGEIWTMLAEKLPPALAESLKDRALNKIGKKDNAANEQWMKDVIAALGSVEAATHQAKKATEELGAERQKLIDQGQAEDDVLKSQATSYSILLAQIKATGAEAPESLRPILDRLLEMGLLVDAAGNKVTDLNGVKFPEMATAAGQAAEATNIELNKTKQRLQELADRGIVGPMRKAWMDAVRYAQVAGEDVDRVWSGKRFTVDVDFNLPSDVPTPPPEPEGEAAAGVMANRPGLVLFGEGGEPEVGGPAQFFKRIFESLGISGNGGGIQAGGGGGNTFVFQVTTMDANGFKSLVENQILPMMVDAVGDNRRQSRTKLQAALGVG